MNYWRLTLETEKGNKYYREVSEYTIKTDKIVVGCNWHGYTVTCMEWIDPDKKEREFLEWLNS